MDALYITIAAFLFVGLLVLIFIGLKKWQEYLIKTNQHPQLNWWIAQAITMTYKLSDQVFDITAKRLVFEQKREVLDVIYDMLPDTINFKFMQLPWKKWVSKDTFIDYVALQYDALVDQYHALSHDMLKLMSEEMKS